MVGVNQVRRNTEGCKLVLLNREILLVGGGAGVTDDVGTHGGECSG